MFGSTKLKEAKRPYTNYVTLREYAESKNTKLRATVAVHPNLQNYVMEKMVNDKSEKVRAALASNPKLSLKAWEVLNEDESEAVKASLKEHHPEPPEKKDARQH
jgi:hypothetical protein